MNNQDQREQDRKLFRQFADGQLNEAECAALENRLLSDTDFRTQYVRAIGVESGMQEILSLMQPASSEDLSSAVPQRIQLLSMRSSLLVASGVVASLMFLAGSWWLATKAPAAKVVVRSIPGQRPVAVVTQVLNVPNAAAAGLKPGMRVSPGTLKLPSGQIQVDFMNGAQVTVEGPAELEIESMDTVFLVTGKAAARVPPSAQGFVLNTPDAAVVDMGTEFGVSIDEAGTSEVQVTEGEVEVSILGHDGNMLSSRMLGESKSVRARRGLPASLETIDKPTSKLPGIQNRVPSALRTPRSYVDAVLASKPDVYWRFEQSVNGHVPNEVQARWNAVIYTDDRDPSSIVIKDGMARFTAASKSRRRIEASEPIPELNKESFTIELWVNPDNFHWATLVATTPVEEVTAGLKRNSHLNLMELPCGDKKIHEPGSFRFLHRSPPGDNYGLNLFTDGDCIPGVWHHLVCVKTPSELKLFLNGRLVRHLSQLQNITYSGPCRLSLGALYNSGEGRRLSGALDEVAIYRHPLEDHDVAGHYRAMQQ